MTLPLQMSQDVYPYDWAVLLLDGKSWDEACVVG